MDKLNQQLLHSKFQTSKKSGLNVKINFEQNIYQHVLRIWPALKFNQNVKTKWEKHYPQNFSLHYSSFKVSHKRLNFYNLANKLIQLPVANWSPIPNEADHDITYLQQVNQRSPWRRTSAARTRWPDYVPPSLDPPFSETHVWVQGDPRRHNPCV